MQELIHLKGKILDLVEVRENKINSGNCEEFTVYKQVAGERTGLLMAVQEIDDLLKRLSEA